MQFSDLFKQKLQHVFPRARGLHHQAEVGKSAEVGYHLEQYLNRVTEEQFGVTFHLQPHQAREQFPQFLEELRELFDLWKRETGAV